MLPQLRYQQILERLARDEFLTVEEGVSLLGASPTTVRRDFNYLAGEGLAERTHGGLRRGHSRDLGALPFTFREVRYSTEKAALAREAASLLRPRDIVTVDGGTTTYHLAQCLPDIPLTVITNSLRLATALGERRLGDATMEVCLTGGYLFPEMGLLAGPHTIAHLDDCHANWAFLSASGICEEGVFNPNAFVVDAERAMIRNADRVAILTDQSKLGQRSMCRVAALAEVDMLITTARPDDTPLLTAIQDAGVQVLSVASD